VDLDMEGNMISLLEANELLLQTNMKFNQSSKSIRKKTEESLLVLVDKQLSVEVGRIRLIIGK
jgi:hypothetical protein